MLFSENCNMQMCLNCKRKLPTFIGNRKKFLEIMLFSKVKAFFKSISSSRYYWFELDFNQYGKYINILFNCSYIFWTNEDKCNVSRNQRKLLVQIIQTVLFDSDGTENLYVHTLMSFWSKILSLIKKWTTSTLTQPSRCEERHFSP